MEGFERNPQDRLMEITVDHTKSAVITAHLAQEQCKVLIDTGAARCCIKEDYYHKLSNAPLRGARSQTSTLGLYSLYFNFSLRTKNKLGCPSFLDFVFVFGFNRYSG